MGEDTVYNALGRSVGLVSSHVGCADQASELSCLRDMFVQLRVLVSVWLGCIS